MTHLWKTARRIFADHLRLCEKTCCVLLFAGMIPATMTSCAPRCDSNAQLINLDTEALLRVLDRTLIDKNIYQQQQRQRIDSIRHRAEEKDLSPREKLRTTLRLVSLYAKHNIDTAFYYAYAAERLAEQLGDDSARSDVRIRIVRLNVASNRLTDAENDLRRIRTAYFGRTRRDDYYGACRLLFDHKAFYEIRDSLAGHYRTVAQAYRDSVLLSVNPRRMTYAIEMSRNLRRERRFEEALAITKPFACRERQSARMAPISHEIANTYREMEGGRDSAMRYLAITAICDLRTPVRDGVAIRDLADLLLENNDIGRASRCISSVVEDAIASNALERIQSATALSKAIDNAYIERISTQKRHLNRILFVLALLVVALLIMTWLQVQKNRKIRNLSDSLQSANDELSQINEQLNLKNSQLSELSNIKDGYICGYMNLCTSYINMIEEYRQEACRVANKSGLEKILNFLRSPLVVEREYKKFYTHFDTTFLSMFPDFIERVNELLTEECRYKMPEGTLSTDLRILAALRLGITNSVQIAEFLHCSKATIFTYRTKMRNAACGDRNEFERGIQRIAMRGISKNKE